MIWHHQIAFTEQELAGRAGRLARVHLAYDVHAGFYQFHVSAGSREELAETLRFVGQQVDRMLEQVQQ
jgi:hypothetical protein